MNKKTIFTLFVSVILFSSCEKNDELKVNAKNNTTIIGEGSVAETQVKQIVSAIENKDKQTLKSLFSRKSIEENSELDNEIEDLFNLVQGDIISYEDNGWSSDESIKLGKRSLMIRFAFDLKTDKMLYSFYVIDYNIDTINPENQGIYMLESIKDKDEVKLSWQDRMRAGIYIH